MAESRVEHAMVSKPIASTGQGLAIDDTTFQKCSGGIPRLLAVVGSGWENEGESVSFSPSCFATNSQ